MATGKYDMYDGIDFSMFEPRQSSYEKNAARKIETAPKHGQSAQPKPQMELIKQPKKTRKELKKEMRATALQSAKIIAISVFLLSMLAGLLYGRLKVDELDREISAAQTNISAAESENVRLNMQLDSMISLEHVEQYAEANLGMVKMESHQIEYIDLSGTDKVTVSGDKTLDGEKESLKTKVLAYLSK